MTGLLRSISTKIFGIALGLVAVMLAVAWWSASAVDRVNGQLRTLSESLVPLALDVQDVRHAIADQQLGMAARLTAASDPAACHAEVLRNSDAVDAKLGAAQAKGRHGAAIAPTERTRLELARVMPLTDALEVLHDRYRTSSFRLCLAPADAETRGDNSADARALETAIDALSDEIKQFTIATAAIIERRETAARQANFIFIAVAGIVGLALAYIVSRGLTRPIARLRVGTLAVEAGRLDGEVPVTTRDEIGDVTRAFNDMLGGLRAKARITETFGRYIDPRVVARLIDAEAGQAEGGAKEVATLFFSDIAGFTALSEALAPALLVTLINDYFATMSAPIRAHKGIIDKYIGDSIMAFWVPPFVDPAEQALLACTAALAQRDLLPTFNARVPDLLGLRRGVPAVGVRMAIATGEAVVGSIGPDFARSFTVMGDTVNLASRLEGTNKLYGTGIIVDAATVAQVGDAVEVRPLDAIQVSGRETPLDIYELAGLAGTATAAQRTLFARYADGLAAYRAADWAAAEAAFTDALRLSPGDGPSTTMLGRVEAYRAAPPADWTGVWRMRSK